jgi:hypothetical protein
MTLIGPVRDAIVMLLMMKTNAELYRAPEHRHRRRAGVLV